MKEECQSCNGTGQISFFQGVSRFLITNEECPECGGLGFIISEEDDASSPKKSKSNRKAKK